MLTVLHGHNLVKLRELATGSVHCWVTSPPYWGLRDYGVEPQIWGGDEKCEHEWGTEIAGTKQTGGTEKSGLGNYNNGLTEEVIRKKISNQSHAGGSSKFCAKCGAWLGSLGLEPTPELYVRNLVLVLREARRVLRDDGTLWLNLGDSYAGSRSGEKRELPHYDGRDDDVRLSSNRVAIAAQGNVPKSARRIKNPASKQATNSASDFPAPHRSKRLPRGPGNRWGGGDNPAAGTLKPKDLVGIPWMVAFALRADGWWLRSRIPWIKRNCMPESCDDRPSTAIEDVFLLSKSVRYFYDAEAVAVPASMATHARLSQNVEARIGSARANGGRKTNGNMKAVGRKMAAAGSGIKNNDDFNNAVCLMVSDRNRRNSDWFLDSWQGLLSNELGEPLALIINTQPFSEAHFATFPPRLVQPMVLAATSARGCCSSCGAPWERVTETGAPDRAHQRACGSDAAGDYTGEATKDFESARAQNASQVKARILRGMNDQKTVGWIPTCKCAGYAVLSTTSRRMDCQRVDNAAHDVAANSKYTGRSNAERVQSLRDSARARGSEYGSTVIVDGELKGDQLDLLGMHHGQNQRRKEPGTFSNNKADRMCIEVSDSARARRRSYYRERWQERINARFPKPVPCTVGDMFGGSGTTGEVALELGRQALLIELGDEYLPMISRRCDVTPSLALA